MLFLDRNWFILPAMHVITGGAGFIGSAFIRTLNDNGVTDIIVVDELGRSDKWKNLRNKTFSAYYHKDEFIELVRRNRLPFPVTAIVHMGACSETTERDCDFLMRNNYQYSVSLAEFAASRSTRFIYASSAATYGGGETGYSDGTPAKELRPLNPYGFSKLLFDAYMERSVFGPAACGLKFFNVYGPNEYHKGDLRSMVVKGWQQAKQDKKVRLFRSSDPRFPDGGQKRDFIYVKDCCRAMWWLLNNPEVKGIFNLGSGKARSWNDLAKAVFGALKLQTQVEYIETPENIRSQYQNFTEAEMGKLAQAGFDCKFTSLEDGVRDYIQNHLERPDAYY